MFHALLLRIKTRNSEVLFLEDFEPKHVETPDKESKQAKTHILMYSQYNA